ncbi:hypothetical protein GCM10010276_58320 [Streptomyces longisporus]|uniref:Uncharacterized protein n=1 Tax=Streptomyces longisporus TaxID=1948 RepID=A0ABN3MPS1_STRLO
MRPPLSRTSTVRPSVSRAPHSSRAAGSPTRPEDPGEPEDPDEDDEPEEPEEEDDEWGGCGWLSGIALQGLGGCAGERKITQSESSLGWRSARVGEERNSRTGVVRRIAAASVAPGRAGKRARAGVRTACGTGRDGGRETDLGERRRSV